MCVVNNPTTIPIANRNYCSIACGVTCTFSDERVASLLITVDIAKVVAMQYCCYKNQINSYNCHGSKMYHRCVEAYTHQI